VRGPRRYHVVWTTHLTPDRLLGSGVCLPGSLRGVTLSADVQFELVPSSISQFLRVESASHAQF